MKNYGLDDFGELSLLTEHVIDKRGFMYHGDQAGPEEFVRLITTGEYDNTASMYGKGLYCVRSPQDAAANGYGPYVYKIYVRGLDTFLHLDQLAYNSVFDGSGPKDAKDSEFFYDTDDPAEGRATASWDARKVMARPSYEMQDGSVENYYSFVLNQLKRLIPDMSGKDLEAVGETFAEIIKDFGCVVFSSDLLEKLYVVLRRYGIPGVTYTGRHDRRCCLVYDMSNVYPVAVADKEDLMEGRMEFTPLRRMASSDMSASLGDYLLKYNHDRRIDASANLTQKDIGARMAELLDPNREGMSRTPETAKKLLMAFSKKDRDRDWFEAVSDQCEYCIDAMQKGLRYYTGHMFKCRQAYFPNLEVFADVVLEREIHRNFGLETKAELLDYEYQPIINNNYGRYLKNAMTQSSQCFSQFLDCMKNVVSLIILETNIRIGAMRGGFTSPDELVHYYVSSSPFSMQSVITEEEAVGKSDSKARAFKDEVVEAVREILDDREYAAKSFINSTRSNWGLYVEGVYFMYINELCEKVLKVAMDVADAQMAKWDELGLPQGGGGAPGSLASEPQTQMESFSGFVRHFDVPGDGAPGKSTGLHGF